MSEDDSLEDFYREEREILYRLDERTARMDERVERIDNRVVAQDNEIDTLRGRVNRNTTVLNALTFGLGTIITTVVAKLQGVIKF